MYGWRDIKGSKGEQRQRVPVKKVEIILEGATLFPTYWN